MKVRPSLLVGVIGTAVTLSASPAAGTSCAGPSVYIRPAAASAGEAVVVSGDGWGTCPEPNGCGLSRRRDIHGIRIALRPAGEKGAGIELAVVDADDERFRVDVRIPAVPPGTYFVLAGNREASARTPFTVPA